LSAPFSISGTFSTILPVGFAAASKRRKRGVELMKIASVKAVIRPELVVKHG